MYFFSDLIIGSRFLIFHSIAWHVHVVYSAMHTFLGLLEVVLTCCLFHIHLCIPESCGFSHIGLVYDFFPIPFIIMWVEWNGYLVLFCPVFSV